MGKFSTIGQRIAELIKAVGTSENALVAKLGWSQGSIGKAVKSGGAVNSDRLEQLLREYPKLNPEWLLTGEGTMFRSGTLPKKESRSLVADAPGEYGAAPGIVMLKSKVAAGLIKQHGLQELLKDQPRMVLPQQQFRSSGLLAIQVTGDSMEPTILDGDWLVVRQLHDPRQEIRPGVVYVVVTASGAHAKRLRVDFATETMVAESDNPDHKPFPITDARPVVYDVLALLREKPGDQRHSFNARLVRVEEVVKTLNKKH